MDRAAPFIDAAELLGALEACVTEVFRMVLPGAQGSSLLRSTDSGSEDAVGHGEAHEPTEAADSERVAVGFDGATKGNVILRCSARCALDIARGLLMMQEDEAPGREEVRDALGECANMLAGSLKTKALDPLGNFRLGLPVFLDGDPEGDIVGRLVYALGDERMSVEAWLEPRGAAR